MPDGQLSALPATALAMYLAIIRSRCAPPPFLNTAIEPATLGLLAQATIEGDHGRIEQRHHAVIHDVGFLSTDRRFLGESRCPGLKAIAMVQAEVERNGKIGRERRFFISSLPLDAELFARAVRQAA